MLTVRTSENTVITSFRLITERQDFSSVRTGENTVRARARIQFRLKFFWSTSRLFKSSFLDFFSAISHCGAFIRIALRSMAAKPSCYLLLPASWGLSFTFSWRMSRSNIPQHPMSAFWSASHRFLRQRSANLRTRNSHSPCSSL